MLQEKKKYSSGCIKMGFILAIIIFLIWSGLFIVLIFVFFIFFGGNKKTNINFTKVLESIGVYDCIKYIFGDYEKKDGNDNRNKGVMINDYLEKINKSIKKRSEELKKKEKIREQKELEQFENTEILWKRPKIEEKIKIRNSMSTEGFNPLNNKGTSFKSKTKTTYSNKNKTSFNNGKSIWDDYESVIDIMNKKK